MKVSSDKQTLILAGEPIPPCVDVGRAVLSRGRTGLQRQHVSMLLVREAPAVPAQRLVPYSSSSSSSRVPTGGAAEYARTQNLSVAGTRSRLIDTSA